MTPEKILAITNQYKECLSRQGIKPKRIDPSWYFKDCDQNELLAHAAYLCEGIKEFTHDPTKYGKANRHLAAIQMCLGFAGMYTLNQLVDHNRPT